MTVQTAPRLGFVYGARETIWPGIIHVLLSEGGAVRDKLLECDEIVRGKLGWSLEEMFRPDQRSPEHVLEPVLTSVQVALTAGWRALGVEPDMVGARCGGEFAAAHVAGRLSLDDALEVACRLSRLIRDDGVPGRMLSLELIVPEVEALVNEGAPFTIAADNHGRTTVVACAEAGLSEVEAFLASRGLAFQTFGTQVAYHNPAVDRWAAEFSTVFGAPPNLRRLPLYSATAQGRLEEINDDGRHFWRVIREPAYVGAMAGAMLRDGCRTFLEVGGFPSLQGMIAEAAQGAPGVRVLSSLQRGETFRAASSEARSVLAALGRCGAPATAGAEQDA